METAGRDASSVGRSGGNGKDDTIRGAKWGGKRGGKRGEKWCAGMSSVFQKEKRDDIRKNSIFFGIIEQISLCFSDTGRIYDAKIMNKL